MGEIMAATATFIGRALGGAPLGRLTLTVLEKSTTTASESPPQPYRPANRMAMVKDTKMIRAFLEKKGVIPGFSEQS